MFMGISRLVLKKQDHFYIIFEYHNPNNNPGEAYTQEVDFSYADRPEKEALKAARKFGKNLSKNLNIPLEEEL